MKFKILVFLLILSSVIYSQNDSIQQERYEVINALFKKGKPTLDKHFYQYLGIGVLISESKLIDDLLGHCSDVEKKEKYSFSDILSKQEISKMQSQISHFSNYRYLDSSKVTNNIRIVDDLENTKPAITLPLVVNNKAIVYYTNKNNVETLFVLVKLNNKWIVRCRKYLYLRFDD